LLADGNRTHGSSINGDGTRSAQELRRGADRRLLRVYAGVVLFHRSGDSCAGLHGNSALWTPTPDSHRIALVLYQTDVKIREG
jgi:hypothetical protein